MVAATIDEAEPIVGTVAATAAFGAAGKYVLTGNTVPLTRPP